MTRPHESKGNVPPTDDRVSIACHHCGQQVMTVARLTEAELIRLTAHLFARHPEHEGGAGWQRLRDVLRHFGRSPASS